MIRTLDHAPFVAIASHPEVLPWLGLPMGADVETALAPIVSNPANFCFLTDSQNGGYMVLRLGIGLYCAHTLSTPDGRGKSMLKLMQDGFRFLYTATDCIEIVTMVPDGAEAAHTWANAAGFRPSFTRKAFFPLMGETVGGSFRSLSYTDWVMTDGKVEGIGRAFHSILETHGAHVNHAEDPVHDRFVGATLLGCGENNGVKAISLYNRWASIAGYGQARIVSEHPFVVDIGNAVIQHGRERLEVLSVTA